MVRGVIFDFDGTLVDSNDIKRKSFYSVTEDIAGAGNLLDKILSTPESGDRYNIFETLSKELKLVNNIIVDSSKLSNLYTELCEHEVSCAPEIEGVSKTVNELKKTGIKLFISSATPENTLKRIIEKRKWDEMFDMVLGSPYSKIDHVAKILEDNNLTVSGILYVGDSEVDKNTALKVGCKFIGIGKNLKRFSSKPSIFLNTLENFTTKLDL